MHQGQKPAGSQRAKKQALLALPVVDELAPYATMHPAGRLPEIENLEVRPIFAKTVGKDPVGRCAATQIHERLTDCLHAADCLYSDRFPCAVVYLHLDGAIGSSVVKLHDVNQTGFARQFAAGHCQLAARAEPIAEGGLSRLATRIVT